MSAHAGSCTAKHSMVPASRVATRFVGACPRGHVDDVDWQRYVHGDQDRCRRQPWLDERGTSGDLSDLVVRCECGKQRALHEATPLELNPLGTCRGTRPWLGPGANESCIQPSRLLTRTASNAYFPQVLSMLSLPTRASALVEAIGALWDDLQIVDDAHGLAFIKRKPAVADRLGRFSDEEVLEAIRQRKTGGDRPIKRAELDALLAAPEGFGDDIPLDPDFHARRLPDGAWRASALCAGIESVIQLHRLREVLALVGFTRFEAEMPDINGEYESDVERAQLALSPAWFPAVENRGEGIFVLLRADAVREWLDRPAVKQRLDGLHAGLVQQARRFEDHLAYAPRSAALCSNDPVCAQHTPGDHPGEALAPRCRVPRLLTGGRDQL